MLVFLTLIDSDEVQQICWLQLQEDAHWNSSQSNFAPHWKPQWATPRVNLYIKKLETFGQIYVLPPELIYLHQNLHTSTKIETPPPKLTQFHNFDEPLIYQYWYNSTKIDIAPPKLIYHHQNQDTSTKIYPFLQKMIYLQESLYNPDQNWNQPDHLATCHLPPGTWNAKKPSKVIYPHQNWYTSTKCYISQQKLNTSTKIGITFTKIDIKIFQELWTLQYKTKWWCGICSFVHCMTFGANMKYFENWFSKWIWQIEQIFANTKSAQRFRSKMRNWRIN